MKKIITTIVVGIIILLLGFFYVVVVLTMGSKQDVIIYSSADVPLYLNQNHIGNKVICVPRLQGEYTISTNNLSATVEVTENSIGVLNASGQIKNLETGIFIQKISNGISDLYFAPVNCKDWTFAGEYQYIIE